jgi:hypothetical protein
VSTWQWIAVVVIVSWAFAVACILRALYVLDRPAPSAIVDEAEAIVRRAFEETMP